MDCNNCQELFSEYLDRHIDESLLLHLEKHLAECPECAEEWESFTAAVAWVRQMQFTAPEGILQAVRQKIADERSNKNLLSRLLDFLRLHDFSLPLPAAAATLAVALLAMLAVKQFSGSDLPFYQPRQSADRNSVAQSATTERTGTLQYDVTTAVPPQPMYQQPEKTAASFSGFDNLLPLQQFGTQFVTATGRTTPFTAENTLMPSPSSRALNFRQFHSQILAHFPPDVGIMVNNLPLDSKLQLSRKLLNDPSWSAQLYNSDTILLYMDPRELKKLHNILADQAALVVPPDARDAAFGSPKKVLSVAVRLH